MSIFHVEDRFFGQPNKQEAYNIIYFFILDGKQHPKNIWFRGSFTFVLKVKAFTNHHFEKWIFKDLGI